MLKHMEIIATVSDQCCDIALVGTLYKTGMNVACLNMAHMTEEGLTHMVNNVRIVSDRIGISVDTEGLEVRTVTTVNKEPIPLKTRGIVKVTDNPDQETSYDCICVSYKDFMNDLAINSDILIDDGDPEVKATRKSGDCLLCEIQNDVTLGSRKSVNMPGVCINSPSLTEKGRNDTLWVIDHDLGFITHSFARNKQDILDIRRIPDERNSPIKIIAKIENRESVNNIEEILEVVYGVAITYGNLGIEVSAEKIPGTQRILTRKCVEVKKPTIVATQILYLMINNPRSICAEVTDIANAIYYCMNALMPSGGTAYGEYPIEAVQTMTKMAHETEETKLSANDIRMPTEGSDLDVTSSLVEQVVRSSSKLYVKVIITDSYMGRTVRYLVAFRGISTVFAICYSSRVIRTLGLSYGVRAVHQPYNDSRRRYFYDTSNQSIHGGRIVRNDMIAYLGGSFGEDGDTGFSEINNVGKVLNADTQYQLPTFKE